ncbi:MAG: 2-C-methyl-D-erythritol 2,4-cyclodiphosphate synthase, partial [Alloprevotella sp.]
DSKILLRRTVALLAENGFSVGNVDITVCAERPKLSPHIDAMRECLAPLLGIPVSRVSVKATTTEQLGFTGRREGISAYAVALIEESK